MRKVLIISTYCFDNASANGLCARAVRDAFELAGYETYLVGFGKSIGAENGIHNREFFVEPDEGAMMLKFPLVNKLKAVLNLIMRCINPNISKRLVGNYYSVILNLDKKNMFDIVIPMFFSPESVVAACELKKKRPKIELVIYELDSNTDGLNHFDTQLFGRYIRAAQIRWSRRQYNIADQICIMQSHKMHFDKLYGVRFGQKCNVVDLPIMSDNTAELRAFDKQTIRFAYTGVLSTDYRSPKMILNILSRTKAQKNWRIYFFSKGNCEMMLANYAETDNRLYQQGYIDSDALRKEYEQMDYFLSIGNTNSNSLPSKIINYISYGKPIIHFSLKHSDVCAEYLNQYPLALVIEYNANPDDSAKRLCDFVDDNFGKRVSYQEIVRLFPKNTPEYSVKSIEAFIKSRNNSLFSH